MNKNMQKILDHIEQYRHPEKIDDLNERKSLILLKNHYEKFNQTYQERINKINNGSVLSRIQYLDPLGNPISIDEWTYANIQSKHVGHDDISGIRISTVWLGLNHSFFSDNEPLIFETMIFADDQVEIPEEFQDYQERYSKLQYAEIGHQKALNMVMEWLKSQNKEIIHTKLIDE